MPRGLGSACALAMILFQTCIAEKLGVAWRRGYVVPQSGRGLDYCIPPSKISRSATDIGKVLTLVGLELMPLGQEARVLTIKRSYIIGPFIS